MRALILYNEKNVLLKMESEDSDYTNLNSDYLKKNFNRFNQKFLIPAQNLINSIRYFSECIEI